MSILKYRRWSPEQLKEKKKLLAEWDVAPRRGIHRIIVVVVDCLRKDHMSLYGYHRNTTPFLDMTAQRGAVFTNAIAAAPWTYPSVVSILTGLYPHNHGAVMAGEMRNFEETHTNMQRLRKDILTMPEVFSLLGYKTFLCTSNGLVDIAVPNTFDNTLNYNDRSSKQVNDVINWLSRHRNVSSLVYLHLMDLHAPVSVPSNVRNVFGDIPNIPDLEYWYLGPAQPGNEKFESYLENRIKLYDAALYHIDSQLKRLHQFIVGQKLPGYTTFIVTADHGEEFWDHVDFEKANFYDPRGFYGIGHGHSLFQELINIPLIITGVGVPSGNYEQVVSNVDIFPTLLEQAGCGFNQKKVDGIGLFNKKEVSEIKDRIVMSEEIAHGYEKKAAFINNFKLISCPHEGKCFLFDYLNDHKEKNNIRDQQPEIYHRLMSYLKTLTKTDSEQLEDVSELEHRLRELGYLD